MGEALMPSYPKSKWESLSISKKQALQKKYPGLSVYDDTGMTTESAMTTHEDLHGAGTTTLDVSPPYDSTGGFANRFHESMATRINELANHKVPASSPPIEPATYSINYPNARMFGPDPSIEQQHANMRRFAKNTAYGAGKMGLAMLGGAGGMALGEMAPAASFLGGVARVAAPAIGEFLGQGGGELARQKLEGEPRNLTRAGMEGGLAGGGRLLAGGIGLVSARAGGVPQPSINAALEDSSLMRPNPEGAYSDFADAVRSSTAQQSGVTTPGRASFESLMQGKTVNAVPLLSRLDEQIASQTGPGARSAKLRLTGFKKQIADRILKVSPTGRMTAEQYDEILRSEFTAPLHEYSGRSGGTQYVQALESARNNAAQDLYQQVGPEAAPSQFLAENALTKRETIENLAPQRVSGKIDVSTPRKLRSLLHSPESNEMMRAFFDYDAQYGTNFTRKLNVLKIKDHWNPNDAKDMEEIVQLGILGYKPRSLVAAAARKSSKAAIRASTSTKLRSAVSSAAGELLQPSHKPTGATK